MHRKLAMAAALIGVLAAGEAAQARPYLMLFADNKGFTALDLGDMTKTGDQAEATVIRAPLDGAPYGAGKADLIKTRMQLDCAGGRWRTASTTYSDAHETVLGNDPGSGAWSPLAADPVGPTVRGAACQTKFVQQSVSRDLNLGEILAHYRRAWGRAQAEPLTEKQLEDQRYKTGH
jgi:hypothetical protein